MNKKIEAQENTTVRYVVPLCDFEKILLEELGLVLKERRFAEAAGPQHSAQEVFQRWKWASLVSSTLKDYLYGETFENEYKGDKTSAYHGFLGMLSHQASEGGSIARATLIQNANHAFLARSAGAVDIQPPEEELPCWKIIASIYSRCLPWVLQLKAFSDHSFDVFRLIKVFTIRLRYPESIDNARYAFFASPAFHVLWDIDVQLEERTAHDVESRQGPVLDYEHNDKINDPSSSEGGAQEGGILDEDEGLIITKRVPPELLLHWPKDKPKQDGNGQMSKDYLTFLLHSAGQHKELECPWQYVCFIPWDNLKHSNLSYLHESGVNTDVPFQTNDEGDGWVLYTPPYPGFCWNHHLYTEDEVYEYTLTSVSLPDHYHNGKVVFRVRDITKTDFLKELDVYWEFWNDCAITQVNDGTDDTLLLLETIPGLRFRSRRECLDEVSALKYFRNAVEAHANGSFNAPGVREIFGLEASYQPAFEHSLRLIPEMELQDVAWEKPLGKGSNGVVYSALWRKPGGILKTSKHAEIEVVLKDVKSRFGTSKDSRTKLIKELDATFASLGGNATACVKFLGVALLRKPPTDITETQYDSRLFLVFERATQESLAEFLPKWYTDMTFFQSWDKTVSALASIGTGISSLHKHKVLHRDLHLNNILVTDRYYPDDQEFPHEFGFLITDIGEGKILHEGREFIDLSDHMASYGAVDFRAPEVHGSENWTAKAEVFSFGVIACKVFRNRQHACTAAPPDWVLRKLQENDEQSEQAVAVRSQIIPRRLRDIIEPCLSYLPDSRPTMRQVVRQLDDFSLDFCMDRDEGETEEDLDIEWSIWDWDDSLRRGRSPMEDTPGPHFAESTDDIFERKTQCLTLD